MIRVEKVKKSYGIKEILKDTSLSIEPRQSIALLGKNGAGKTTLINLLMGLEQPDQGSILIFNEQPSHLSIKQKISLVPQYLDFPDFLNVTQMLEFIRAHYTGAYSVAEIIQRFDMQDMAKTSCAVLSGGQKRKLAIAMAYIGRPEIMILDEPTIGLDVATRRLLWNIINDYQQRHGTLIFTTHYLEEAEAIANRVLILQKGKIKFDGSVDEIKRKTGMNKIKFHYSFPLPPLSKANIIEQNNNEYTIYSENTDELIRELVINNIDFTQLITIPNTLENAYLSLANEEN